MLHADTSTSRAHAHPHTVTHPQHTAAVHSCANRTEGDPAASAVGDTAAAATTAGTDTSDVRVDPHGRRPWDDGYMVNGDDTPSDDDAHANGHHGAAADTTTDVAAHPVAKVLLGEADSGTHAPAPFSIAMMVATTRKHRRARPREQQIVFDTGSGPSLAEKAYLQSIGCKIHKTESPLFFHGFHDDTSGSNACTTSEYAMIHVTNEAAELDTTYKVWAVQGSPVRILIGRDMMSKADGHGVLIDPDPEQPHITFGDGPPVPATPHGQVMPSSSLCITVSENVSIPGGPQPNHDLVLARTKLAAGTDVHIHAHTRGEVNVPDQVQTTGENGDVQVWVVNNSNLAADWAAGSALGKIDRLEATPLHPATRAMLATEQLAAEQHTSDPDHHQQQQQRQHQQPHQQRRQQQQRQQQQTPPEHSHGVAQAFYAESKPTSADTVRSQGWAQTSVDVEVDAEQEYTDSLPTEAELDGVLQGLVRDMQMGDKGQQRRALAILRKNAAAGLFSTKTNKTGLLKDHPASFTMRDNKPSFQAPYPMSPSKETEVIRQAKLMLAEGLIHPTTSPNNVPLLLVDKPGGRAPRLCMDLRRWNANTVTCHFELPGIRDIANVLATSRAYSQVDCTSGYQMVPLADDDGPVPSSHQLAFTLPRNHGRFAMSRLTFGVADAMHTFDRAMTAVLRDHFDYCSVYVDDCNIHSGSAHMDEHEIVEEHLVHLDNVLTALAKAGAKLGAHKTKIFQTKITALGLYIADGVIQVDREKYRAIDELRPPATQKELQVAMGLLGIARSFCPGFAGIAEPLHQLMSGDHRSFKWLPQHQQAFDTLRRRLKSTKGLHAPNWDLPFEVWADASQTSSGGMLLQRDASGVPRVVEYMSHRFTTPERNYNTPERECLALILAAKRFRKYLLASNRFAIALVSDHKGLTYLHRNSDTNSRLYRWAQSLGDYNYKIHWVPGSEQGAADALSRLTAFISTTASTFADSKQSNDSSIICNNDTCVIDRFVTAHKSGSSMLYRVRWQGYGPDDDTLEPLKTLRKQLSARALRQLRDGFDVRTSAADDEQLSLLVGSPPLHKPGIQSYAGPANDPHPLVAEAAMAESLDHLAGDSHAPHNDEFRTELLPGTQLLPSLSVETIVAHQRQDPRLLTKRAEAASDSSTYRLLPSGLLCKTHTPTVGPRQGHDITVIAVPESLVPLCLAAVHDLAGHHGSTSTIFHMQSRFSFPRLYTRTLAYVRGCKQCGQAKKDSRPCPQGKIPVYGFLHTVGLDFAGPFAASAGEPAKKYLAILVDHATKWTHVVATKSTSSKDAADALLDFVQHFGLPLRLVTDRGSAFTASAWGRLMRVLSIDHTPTLSYNPRGDSHAETSVGNVKALVRIAIGRHPRHWHSAAKWACWSYNCSYHSTLGTTPFYARHGREPRHLSDTIFQHPAAKDSVSLSELVQRVDDVHRTTQKNIQKIHDRVAARNDKINRSHKFELGGLVWLHRVFPGTKSPAANGRTRAWFWPYRPDLYVVDKMSSPQHVRIRLHQPHDGKDKAQTVHVHRLKPFHPSQDAFTFGDLNLLDATHHGE